MKRIYPLALVLFLAFWALGVYWGGAEFRIFLSLAALVLVVGATLVLCLCSFSPGEIVRAFALGFHRGPADAVELKNAILFFKALALYLLLGGIIGLFIGIVIVLWALEDPERLAAGLATSLITLLYSLVLIAGVALPFRTGLTRRLHELES